MDREMASRRVRLAAMVLSGLLLACVFGAQAPAAGALGFEFKGAFGPNGSNATGFSKAGPVAVDNAHGVAYVLDPEQKTLFKFDLEGNPVNFGGSSPNVSGNELSGLSVGEGLSPRQVAVNPNTGTIYLTGGYEPFSEKATALQAFEPDGDPALFSAGPGKGTNEITGFPNLRGVAVDANGAIYVGGTTTDELGVFSNRVSVYSESGALLVPSVDDSLGSPANLAVDSNGNLYALANLAELVQYKPSKFPVTASTTYTKATHPGYPRDVRSVSVDPLTNRLYAAEFNYEEGTRISVFSEEGTLEGSFAGHGEAGELAVPYGIAVADVGEFGGTGDIAQPLVADNPEGGVNQVKIFREIITVAPPTVETTTAATITGDSATLRAKVNPNNRETSYWFEYGPSSCAASTCARAPLSAASIGNGRKGVTVTQPVAGLLSATTYHFRVVAENEEGTTDGPEKTFTTEASGLGFLLGDSRTWEMVSPRDKFGGEVVVDDTAIVQAAASGEELVYASLGSLFADPQGSRSPQPTTVLSARATGGGWSSQDLSPPHTEATLVSGDSEFKLFSANLLKAAMEPMDETPLSPDASEQTPYQWSAGAPPLFTPLVDPANVPPGTVFGPNNNAGLVTARLISIEGASPDLGHVAINSVVPLAQGASSASVYLWSDGELEAVSELPPSEGGAVVFGMLGSGHGSVRHAVSSDGTRVFWGPTQHYSEAGIEIPALYLRDTVRRESVRLDVPQPGASGEGKENPAFNIASADGSVVFFTDSQQLTQGASPSGRDLYRCAVGPVGSGRGCVELTDISAPLTGSGENAEVLDQVPGASEDGTSLYFLAKGVLDKVANGDGEVAVPGAPNLYHWQQGRGVRYIATLSEQDGFVWGASYYGAAGFAQLIGAQASPDGSLFTFTSDQSLTGHENLNGSDEPTGEVFLYDANADRLTCVSCAPTGAAPVGERLTHNVDFPPAPNPGLYGGWMAATLPTPSSTGSNRSLYHPRAVLDNGRVFFNSVDPLVPADTNARWDVYEYEPLGLGSCTANTNAAAETRLGAGCVALISSGSAEGDAGFLDASPSGNDVFFVTHGRLSALDHDNEVDVYDARVDGTAATLPVAAECLGETCQAAAQAPNDATPSSASFAGQGNVKAKPSRPCARGKRKVRHNGKTRCVRRRSKQKSKRAHRRAKKSRGAGR